MGNNILNLKNFSLPSDAEGVASSSYNFKHLQKDFKFLNEKLSSVSKEATQWDFLKIDFILVDSANFESAQYSLVPNTAFVINCNSFTWKGQAYSRGDIVYKDIDNTVHHIQAEHGGMWYPSQLTKKEGESFYTLTFESAKGLSQPRDTTLHLNEKLDEPYETISFTDITTEKGAVFYSINVEFNPDKTPFPNDSKYRFEPIDNVFPIIKGYSSSEEIYWDAYLSKDAGSNYSISLPKILTRLVVK